jgi:hypothetical protein
MPKPRAIERQKHRKRFSGIRDDTKTVDFTVIGNGVPYNKRHDGSLYPKNTTITVTESTRRIYACFREAGGYNNYDELLLDIALPIVKTRKLPVSHLPNKSLILTDYIIRKLESNVTQAKMDRGFRGLARSKAVYKRRYYRRKTSIR